MAGALKVPEHTDAPALELDDLAKELFVGRPIGDVFDVCASMLSRIIALDAKTPEEVAFTCGELSKSLLSGAIEDFHLLKGQSRQ